MKAWLERRRKHLTYVSSAPKTGHARAVRAATSEEGKENAAHSILSPQHGKGTHPVISDLLFTGGMPEGMPFSRSPNPDARAYRRIWQRKQQAPEPG